MGKERIVLPISMLGLGDLGAGVEQWPLCLCRYCGPEPICKAMPGAGTPLLGCLVRVHPSMLLMRNGLCGECWEARTPLGGFGSSSKDEKNDKKKDEPDEPDEPSKGDKSKDGKREVIKPSKKRLVIKPSKGSKAI